MEFTNLHFHGDSIEGAAIGAAAGGMGGGVLIIEADHPDAYSIFITIRSKDFVATRKIIKLKLGR